MLRTRNILLTQRRWKGGKHRWSVVQKKKAVTDRVLENLDDFYGTVFGIRWNNMRAALLAEQKYIAMVNNFGEIEKTCKFLEMTETIFQTAAAHECTPETANFISSPIPQTSVASGTRQAPCLPSSAPSPLLILLQPAIVFLEFVLAFSYYLFSFWLFKPI